MAILDVGGFQRTFPEATHIIDIMPKDVDCTREYVQQDICETPWPYKDKEFDFVYCSNVLEDIKDPVRVCKEMMRVGKKGRIIVPSIYLECTKGIDTWPRSELYTGYVHHRWLCLQKNGKLLFVQKTPITHVFDWTKGLTREEILKKGFLIIEWEDSFEVEENIKAEFQQLVNILKEAFKDGEKR